jgi:hypothetical protein
LKLPRRIAERVVMPKKISTVVSHEPLVGVKCIVTLGFCPPTRDAGQLTDGTELQITISTCIDA